MGKRRGGPGEINAGSMADIAFLLLIFFLVTTTMDQDTGIMRQLPPPLEDEVDPPIVKEKNVFVVLANAQDQLLVEGELLDISELKEKAVEFLTNPSNRDDLPSLTMRTKADCESKIAQYKALAASSQGEAKANAEKELKDWQGKLTAVELIGEYRELPKAAVISLQNDRGTSYNTYIQVQNELQSAVNELRNSLSKEKFGVAYNELDPKSDEDKPKIIAIRKVYPQRISEAEPRSTGNAAAAQ